MQAIAQIFEDELPVKAAVKRGGNHFGVKVVGNGCKRGKKFTGKLLMERNWVRAHIDKDETADLCKCKFLEAQFFLRFPGKFIILVFKGNGRYLAVSTVIPAVIGTGKGPAPGTLRLNRRLAVQADILKRF